MNTKTISVIALSNRDYPSLAAKLAEAVQWIEFAAGQGADLAVLPETINFYRGDGPGNPHALTYAEAALDDWERATQPLFEVAKRCGIAVTIPVLVRAGDQLRNMFALVAKTGRVLGEYQKAQPTAGELQDQVQPGQPAVFEWDGLTVGGAICFDTNFLRIFDEQARQGAQLFLVPSLWPGGSALNYYARRYGTPIALAYPAWSRIIDSDGTELVAGGYRHETLRFGFGAPVYTATINFDRVALHSDTSQQQIVAIQKKYGAAVGVRFDQQNCVFYLESRSAQITVAEIMREFHLMSVQEYLAQFPMARG